jgi:hypothetical protein
MNLFSDRGLLPFDKLNIAFCARQRALLNTRTMEGFEGEHDTVHLWMRHRLQTMGGCNWSF